jgi:hypothetical protein
MVRTLSLLVVLPGLHGLVASTAGNELVAEVRLVSRSITVDLLVLLLGVTYMNGRVSRLKPTASKRRWGPTESEHFGCVWVKR